MAESSLSEALADVQHEIWAHWMRYLFSVSETNSDGTVTIPSDKVATWRRQCETRYFDLTEKERASDVEQADKVVELLNSRAVELP